ncbi:Ig-like domain-containing protein, partial [Ensifer sp. M14]|uniref:Ig-like domain-containing protein n=1 Tax=Ensifer sp. M14 TaxID=2203782 RepID=UPI001FCE959C
MSIFKANILLIIMKAMPLFAGVLLQRLHLPFRYILPNLEGFSYLSFDGSGCLWKSSLERTLAKCASILFGFIVFWTATSSSALACNWTLDYTSIAQSISLNTTSCDAKPTVEPEWGGLFRLAGTEAAYSYGVGADAISGDPKAEDVSGSNGGVYTFTYYKTTGTFNIALKSAPTGGSGSVTLYSYTGIDQNGNGSPANTLNTFTIAYSPLAVANVVSATVAASSSNNPVTLNITGGVATSVGVASAAAHGTATASGTTITYTPTAGYSGSDSFTYTATNASGTSAPATVTITVSAPTIAISPGTMAGGTVGSAYSQAISASGGTAPYSYAITAGALP